MVHVVEQVTDIGSTLKQAHLVSNRKNLPVLLVYLSFICTSFGNLDSPCLSQSLFSNFQLKTLRCRLST